MVRNVSIQILFALFSIIFLQATSNSSVDSLPLRSLRIKPNANQGASSCSYRVRISTSCSSVRRTSDQISLSFGDAYGNQVYSPRIDNPSAHTFEACSKDTFDIVGPCTYDVCYVYLYRRGNSGWKVDTVSISGQRTRTATFNFKAQIPPNTWFGFNHCKRVLTSPLRNM